MVAYHWPEWRSTCADCVGGRTSLPERAMRGKSYTEAVHGADQRPRESDKPVRGPSQMEFGRSLEMPSRGDRRSRTREQTAFSVNTTSIADMGACGLVFVAHPRDRVCADPPSPCSSSPALLSLPTSALSLRTVGTSTTALFLVRALPSMHRDT